MYDGNISEQFATKAGTWDTTGTSAQKSEHGNDKERPENKRPATASSQRARRRSRRIIE